MFSFVKKNIAHISKKKKEKSNESNWLKDYSKDFNPVYYKRYVNDTVVLFNKPEHAQYFLEYINKKYKNIKFSIETEINRSLSFLDIKIF